MRHPVGILGLGIMGSAIGANLLRAGWRVVGCDVLPERRDAFAAEGGGAVRTAREVAEAAPVVLSLLPGPAALDEAVTGPEGLLAAGRPLTLAECSTLHVEDKARTAEAMAAAGSVMLDCPLSGTGAQARTGDLSVYASGDTQAIERCRPVFAAFARSAHDLGAFGNGSRMKYIANLLVAIHNVAAAEAMTLGLKAGLDPQTVYDVVRDGAGTSRMFEIRGPMMVEGRYRPATMKVEVWQKDMDIIGDFARRLGCPTPLLAAAAQVYTAAMAQGRAQEDTGAVCAVLEEAARVVRGDAD